MYVQQTNKTIMTTIAIPNSLHLALNSATNSAVSQAIATLADKYGFDAEEAGRELKLTVSDIKGGKPAKGFKKNGEPKKKRGTTGYLVFSKENREETKAAMEAELASGEKLQPKLVVKRLAELWKELSKDEQAVWNAKAAATNEESASASDDSASDAGSQSAAKKVPVKKIEPPVKAKGKAKAEVKSSDDEKSTTKKRAPNAYLFWANASRAEVKAELQADLDEGDKVKGPDLTKALAAKWKNMTADEQAEWKAKAIEAASDASDSD